MKNVIGLHEARNGNRSYKVDFKESKSGVRKLVLPATPPAEDTAGLCEWLTEVFARNPLHPITGASWQGAEGPDGQIVIHRAGKAKDIRFDPARHLNAPVKVIESLSWFRSPGDNAPHAYNLDHCRVIAWVVGTLCDTSKAETVEQEAEALLGAFTQLAEAVAGHTTRGTQAQRFEAATALRRDIDEMTGRTKGRPRYLIERATNEAGELLAELAIPVGDFTAFARNYLGRSLTRGWLDSRMETLGWERIMLDAHAIEGRSGRHSPHARIGIYRGRLPLAGDESVTT